MFTIFSISSSEVPFFTSMHKHSPFLSPRSAMSTTAGSSLFLVSSATVSRNFDVFPIIVHGISVIQIVFRPYPASRISYLPLTLSFPIPVSYISRMTSLSALIYPPVAKSGPGRTSIISSSVISGFFRYIIRPSITSPKLCVGISLSIPTAIPDVPLTKIFGT